MADLDDMLDALGVDEAEGSPESGSELVASGSGGASKSLGVREGLPEYIESLYAAAEREQRPETDDELGEECDIPFS